MSGEMANISCAAEASGGMVDPTLAVDLQALGYDRDWSERRAVDARRPLSGASHARAATATVTDRGEPWRAVTIHSGGLATSSLLVRRWWRDGEAVHHVLDPHTGLPVEPCWRTAALAPDGAIVRVAGWPG